MRLTSVILLSTFLSITACRPIFSGAPSLASTSPGKAPCETKLLEGIQAMALAAYRLQGETFSLSGSIGTDEFCVHDTTIAEKAKADEVATRISETLNTIYTASPWAEKGWSSGGKLNSLHYSDGGFAYYIDYVVTQEGPDVEVLVLYKGFRR